MASQIATEILIIILLILVNGFLAMSELAVLMASRNRLQARARDGHKGAQTALDIAQNPTQFLSTVQVGITLVGIIAGAFGGATIAEHLATALENIPFVGQHAEAFAVAIIVACITFLSVIFGELVPKRIAITKADRIAAFVARPMRVVSSIAAPFVWILSRSTEILLKLSGLGKQQEPEVTTEEIRALVAQGAQLGSVHKIEENIINRVLRMERLRAVTLMTPRQEVVFLKDSLYPNEALEIIMDAKHQWHPVISDNAPGVVGIVSTRNLLEAHLQQKQITINEIMDNPEYVPEHAPAHIIIEAFRNSDTRLIIVVDEFGTVSGIISLPEILDALAGERITEESAQDETAFIQRTDGTWLVDGLTTIEEFLHEFDIQSPEAWDNTRYSTLGGLTMALLHRIPKPGDCFEWCGFTFEIIDMDGYRVDKLLITPPDDVSDGQ